MEAVSTRQRAWEVALDLFSHRGYAGVSMGDVADALGIKAPSLYKHFKGGKEELYAALFPPLEAHYTDLWAGAAQRQAQLERELEPVGLITAQQLDEEAMAWFRGEMEDAQATAFRRLMALGQFQRPDLPQRWLWAEPLARYEGFFTRLIQQGVLRRGDPHVMAVEYLAPLNELLAQQDRNPERREVCLEEARQHIRQFHRVFAHREQRGSAGPVSRLFRR